MSNVPDPICCQGSKCEDACFWDDSYIEKCLQISCCDGYCQNCCDDICSPSREKLDLCCDNDIFGCISCCCICYYWCYPMFILIVSSFWLMIIFFTLFMPPMIFVLLGLPFLRAKKFDVFSFIETPEQRADTSSNGHVENPCGFLKKGWFRCFIICILLCALGWIPGVFFTIGFIFYYFYCMIKEGW